MRGLVYSNKVMKSGEMHENKEGEKGEEGPCVTRVPINGRLHTNGRVTFATLI